MPGFRDKLNESTSNIVDFRRAGSLLFSSHRYSYWELAERGFVISSSALGGFLAWNLKKSKLSATLGLGIGFLVAHSITMYPLVKKRLLAKAASEEMRDELIKQYPLKDKGSLDCLILKTVALVMQHKDSRSASVIWGKRQRLMTTLVEWSKNESLAEVLPQLLEQDNIIELLNKNTPVISQIASNSC